MKRQRLFLNLLLLQVILFLAWLAIQRVYLSSARSDREIETLNPERPNAADHKQVESVHQNTVYTSQPGTSTDPPSDGSQHSADDKQVESVHQNTVHTSQPETSTDPPSGGNQHSGNALQEPETLPIQSHDGQDTAGAMNAVTSSDAEKSSPAHTSNNLTGQVANYGEVNSGIAAGSGIVQSINRQKALDLIKKFFPNSGNDPDKVFSPYMRPYNESLMCKESKDSNKHKMVLTPETKLIMYWQENDNFPERRGGFRQMCTYPTDGPCEITWKQSYQTRADAIVFHASRIFRETLPFQKRPGQVWVARALESPVHWREAYRSPAWRGVFNYTFTYRPDSDFFSPVGSIMKLPERDYPDYKEIAMKKTRSVAWFVSDCKTDSRREEYVKELKKYIDVHIYGECGNLVCSKDQRGDCIDLLSKTYRFYLSFENSLCNYYITEKFFNKFGGMKTSHHVIPVVRGGTNYRKYFPEGTFIDAADFKSPKDLASYLNKFRTDSDAYAALLARKDQFGSVSCSRGLPWCQLCNMLHDKNIKPKVYTDLGAWWDQEACVEPTDF